MNPAQPVTAAVYLRVSTDDQHTENQLPALESLAAQRGYVISHRYEEKESAKKARPVFEQMMKDAEARRFKVLLVWGLDRLQRSMTGAMLTVYRLDQAGVAVVSSQESWLDTTGPVRQLLIAIFGWVAEQEHARIVERTRAGLARARKLGKRLGRPRVDSEPLRRALSLLAAGTHSPAQAASVCGVSARTVKRRRDASAKTSP